LAKSDTWQTDNGYREYEAGLSLPLWLPGQRGAKRSIADNLDTQASAELRLLAWQVAGETQERAWALRLAQTEVEQAKRQWQSARALERDVRARFRAGELARNDRALAEQETLEREVAHQGALLALEQQRAGWRSYTGLTVLPVNLGQGGPLGEAPSAPHPRLAAALSVANTARAHTDDVRLSRRSAPVLTLYAKRDRGGREDPFTNSVGVELSVAFGSRSHAAPRIAEAEAQLTEAQVNQAAVNRELELDRQQARQAMAQAGRALTLAERRDQLARSRTQLTERAFKLGETDLYLLLIARQQAAAAARDLELSRLKKQRAITRYNHALGAMPR
jgi:outer membrane protein TolC